MEVIDMAALAKLCYFRHDCLQELVGNEKHKNCTPFRCDVFDEMYKPKAKKVA